MLRCVLTSSWGEGGVWLSIRVCVCPSWFFFQICHKTSFWSMRLLSSSKVYLQMSLVICLLRMLQFQFQKSFRNYIKFAIKCCKCHSPSFSRLEMASKTRQLLQLKNGKKVEVYSLGIISTNHNPFSNLNRTPKTFPWVVRSSLQIKIWLSHCSGR